MIKTNSKNLSKNIKNIFKNIDNMPTDYMFYFVAFIQADEQIYLNWGILLRSVFFIEFKYYF